MGSSGPWEPSSPAGCSAALSGWEGSPSASVGASAASGAWSGACPLSGASVSALQACASGMGSACSPASSLHGVAWAAPSGFGMPAPAMAPDPAPAVRSRAGAQPFMRAADRCVAPSAPHSRAAMTSSAMQAAASPAFCEKVPAMAAKPIPRAAMQQQAASAIRMRDLAIAFRADSSRWFMLPAFRLASLCGLVLIGDSSAASKRCGRSPCPWPFPSVSHPGTACGSPPVCAGLRNVYDRTARPVHAGCVRERK